MFSTIMMALLPIALLVGLGYGLRRVEFVEAGFWSGAEKLCYFILLPCLFIHGLVHADMSGIGLLPLCATLILPGCIVGIVLVVLNRLTGFDGKAFTSVFQGSIRFNNYVGVTASIALFGAQTVGLTAVVNAILVPTVNILTVLAFARYGGTKPSLIGVVRGIASNPLVVSCAIGAGLHAFGLFLPFGIDEVMRILGAASLPIGLLCVGAALDLSMSRSRLWAVGFSSMVKFIVIPALTLGLCLLTEMDGQMALVVLVFQCLPTASSSYVMARRMGGDHVLMASITAFETLAAMVTMPITLLICMEIFAL